MEKKTGYSMTTYKLRLYCSHKEWLYGTRDMYNLVLGFYYEVLQKEPKLAGEDSGRKILRELELLTIGTRGQEEKSIKYPLPYRKVPLYFRRAAINDAIRLMRSYISGKGGAEADETEGVGNIGVCSGRTGQERKIQKMLPAQEFHASPIFYKGMYKDFTETGICLKLWNGEKWVWEECRLDTCGRSLPETERLLSPVLKLKGRKSMLHVPVKEDVEDVRTAKERFLEEGKICAAAFPDSGCMAVLTVLDKDGRCLESRFIRGGSQLQHEKQKLLNRIKKNRESMGGREAAGNLPEENKYLKEKIRNLTDTYAHRVSREIVDFCGERGICILVVPNYKGDFDFHKSGFFSASSYDWLGRRMIQHLRYKAFRKGIVVVAVRA